VLYSNFGNLSSIQKYYHPDQISFRYELPAIQKKINQDKMLIAKNEIKVSIDPNFLAGWQELANLYQLYEQYEKSELAYKRALSLAPNNEKLLYNYLRLKAHMHDGKCLEEDCLLLSKLLESNPKHKGALNLFAVNQFKSKNFSQAITYWNKVIALLDVNNASHTDTKVLLEKMIAKAKQELQSL
jgi:cytochrome c-type biogenesis protein CcmH